MLIQCELIDYVIKKRHTQRAEIRTLCELNTAHDERRRRKTPTVVLDCSLKSISSNYLRHNFNFIVDQSVNFTFSYPPWSAAVCSSLDTAAVFIFRWWCDEKDEKSADRYNTVNGLVDFGYLRTTFFYFAFFRMIATNTACAWPPIAIT